MPADRASTTDPPSTDAALRLQLQERANQIRLELIDYATEHSLDELLQKALDEVGALVDSPIGFYHFVEPDGVTLHLQQWSTRTLAEYCHAEGKSQHYPIDQAGIWADCARTGAPVIHNDYAAAPNKRGLPPGHAQLERELVVPVKRRGKIVAILGVGNKPTLYDEVDLEVVTRVADMTWQIVELKRMQEQARRERDLAQTYLDIAGVLIVALDREGMVTLINQAGADMVGEPQVQIVGTPWFERFIPEQERPEVLRAHAQLMRGEIEPVRTFENTITDANGEKRLIEWRNALLHDARGEITGTLSSGTDVTERRRLEAEFRQAQKMEAVGRLAGGVAHDFNNMLTIINSFAGLALEELREGDPLKDDLKEILTAGERAAALTRQLLAFSRKQVVEPKTLQVNEVVAQLEKMLRRLIGEDIELAVQLGEGLGLVRIDPAQLEQILMNLAVNARDAMPKGGVLTIETSNEQVDGEFQRRHPELTVGPHVLLKVADAGTGMTAEVCDRIFEPFFTTKAEGQGTGLGLSTVYGIVRQSGGAILCDSELGHGTRFAIYLPRQVVAGERDAIAPPAARRGGSECVLVVEDEPTVRRLASRILKSAGYRVLTAETGGDALLACEQHGSRIDLLLTDVVMPRLSGPALAKRVEVLRPGVKVLFMSGYTGRALRDHGLDEAEVPIVTKPFGTQSLLDKVRRVLDAE